jgi:AcrR family transcriptional regulator
MPPGRRGPRSDIDVRRRLIDTAENLLGAQPWEPVSLRAIAREAGVAPAALMHYFPTREDLLEALLAKRFGTVRTSMRNRLTALIEQQAPVRVEDVVAAAIQPVVDVVDADPLGGFRWVRIFNHLALIQSPVWTKTVNEPGLVRLYLKAAARAMPNLTDVEVQRRTMISLNSALTTLANADLDAYGRPLDANGLDPLFVEQLLLFTSAGLAAVPPAKSATKSGRRPTKPNRKAPRGASRGGRAANSAKGS